MEEKKIRELNINRLTWLQHTEASWAQILTEDIMSKHDILSTGKVEAFISDVGWHEWIEPVVPNPHAGPTLPDGKHTVQITHQTDQSQHTMLKN